VKIQTVGLALLLSASPVLAQDPAPAPAAAPAATFPSIKVGVTLFADYTIEQQPKREDADGNIVSLSAFQITRSYINVTGNISKHVSFRVTPDITRETGVGSSLSGSYTFRLKYAYAQFNLDDFLTDGSYARLGMQPTPWIGFIDEVYRYRFQGPLFEDREGFLSSADTGATFRYNLPGGYGDVHGGFYNGETYTRQEVNDQKAFQVRGTLRPAPSHDVLRGLRLTGFYDKDAYVKNADRTRAIVAVTFEHPRVNAGFDFLSARDQNASAALAPVEARGWSAWITPRLARGWEGLLRFDQLKPDKALSARKRTRTIAGVAYWFPRQGNVASALLFDVDNTKSDGYSPTQPPTQRRIAVHTLVAF
jgi:hypothetical protein